MIISFIKKYPLDALILLGVIFALWYFGKGCFTPKQQDNTVHLSKEDIAALKPTRDTTINVINGTAEKVQPIVIQTTPATQAAIPIEYQNLSSNVAELTRQVQSLAATLYATNHFDNTFPLKDSTGKQVGEINLPQDVYGNKLQPFTPKYKLQIPIITNNIPYPVLQPYIERNKLSIGGGVFGNQFTPISGLKAGILAQNKRGLTIELNATRTWNYWGGDFGVYKVLSLRKKE